MFAVFKQCEKAEKQETCNKTLEEHKKTNKTSVVDPDPIPDPAIFVSDLQ
jgi:hypothetical protein